MGRGPVDSGFASRSTHTAHLTQSDPKADLRARVELADGQSVYSGGRAVYELRGICCLPLELMEPTRRELPSLEASLLCAARSAPIPNGCRTNSPGNRKKRGYFLLSY